MIKVAINGFGRIGRAFFRLSQEREEIEVVAINDLAPIENLAYLLTHDTVYGSPDFEVEFDAVDPAIIIDGERIPYLSEKSPSSLPWGRHEVDVVVESTGVFTTYEKSQAHLEAGAKRVVISAPVKGDPVEGIDGGTVLMGVNDGELATAKISSNASCTTNAGSGVMKVLSDTLGVEKAMLNTIHAYTASQDLVDAPNRKIRRGRAAAQNIVPTSTGAAIATTKVVTRLENKFDGVALRVPVPAGSIADITFLASRETSVNEVNKILEEASSEEHWAGVFAVTRDPVVSSDIIGQKYAGIVDLEMTRVVDGDLVKIMVWYDNEMGYSNTLVDHVIKSGQAANQE